MITPKYGRRHVVMCYDCDFIAVEYLSILTAMHRHRNRNRTHETASLNPDLVIREYPSLDALQTTLSFDPGDPPF